jgi:photosystem II stability/assembly factor-like uncharacterized protein
LRARRAARLLALLLPWALRAGVAAGSQRPESEPQRPDSNIITTLILFAAAPSGLYRSRDWGGSWRLVEARGGDDPQQVGPVQAILPVGPDVYVGGANGLAVSRDFGESWKRLDLAGPIVSLLASRYAIADPTVFAGTPGGLLRSRDAGLKFEPLGPAGTPVFRMEWPGPALLAATGRGVLRSDDSGDSWKPPGTGLPPGPARALAPSAFFVVDPTLFTSVGSAGVFYSADGGASWSAKGLAGHTVNDLVWFGPYVYAAAEEGLFRSEDAGATWKPLGEGLAGRRVRQLLFPAAPDSGAEALVATDDGIFRTFDGGHHWARVGLQGEAVSRVATFPPPERALPGRPR